MSANSERSITPNVELVRFPVHGDKRGSLIALEGGQDVPFEIRRVYYIYGTEQNIPRGFHAHRTLEQMLVAFSGSVTIHVEYRGNKEQILLDSPDKGLLLKGLVWREMHNFSEDCVLVTLASDHYDESDYIRDYQEFRKMESEGL